MNIDKGLLGGSTVLMLLSLLRERDRYGYEIIRELELRSDRTFQLKEGTLYPVLHRLENDGYLKSYLAKGETGKERKYYRITAAGVRQLAEEKQAWTAFAASVNRVVAGEPNAFAL